MKRALFQLWLCLILLSIGCTRKSAPPTTRPDPASVERVWLYGPRASAADIVWQPSGLGIRVLAPGQGVAPLPSDHVRVHYLCQLKDGKVVDDSRARGQPAEFVVKSLIAGWAEGMLSLKPGGHAEFFVPPSLGYGNRGIGQVPPGSGLIFDVELIAVNASAP